jgi:hypothetical protein
VQRGFICKPRHPPEAAQEITKLSLAGIAKNDGETSVYEDDVSVVLTGKHAILGLTQPFGTPS